MAVGKAHGTPTGTITPLTEAALDEILALQILVAWAGEGLCRPKRLGWWETDLVDPDGGGDLLARLAPRTHAWAALEAVREAARQVDTKARERHGQPDRLRSLYFLGFERAIHTIETELESVRQRYVEVRKRLLSQQNLAAEQAQARIKALPGFAALDADKAHGVLRPILDARVDTSPEAVSPTLVVVRDTFASRLARAEERARDRLDEERNKTAPQKVVKVEANLRGREIGSRDQLHAVFEELEERIGPLLDSGKRVRIS